MAIVLFSFKPSRIERFSKCLSVLRLSIYDQRIDLIEKWGSVAAKWTHPSSSSSSSSSAHVHAWSTLAELWRASSRRSPSTSSTARWNTSATRSLQTSELWRGQNLQACAPTALVQPCHLTTVQSAPQRHLGVHRRDGQRNRYPWCQLGAAVRSPQQCQVSRRNRVLPSLCVFRRAFRASLQHSLLSFLSWCQFITGTWDANSQFICSNLIFQCINVYIRE